MRMDVRASEVGELTFRWSKTGCCDELVLASIDRLVPRVDDACCIFQRVPLLTCGGLIRSQLVSILEMIDHVTYCRHRSSKRLDMDGRRPPSDPAATHRLRRSICTAERQTHAGGGRNREREGERERERGRERERQRKRGTEKASTLHTYHD